MKENTRVEITYDAAKMTARICGEIDHHSAREIRREIDDNFEASGAEALALDMSRVRFMDSSGLGLILGRFSRVQASGGSFAVVDPSESVRRVLDIAGVGRIVDIRESAKRTPERAAIK